MRTSLHSEKSLQQSIGIHLLLALPLLAAALWTRAPKKNEVVAFEVFENPKVSANSVSRPVDIKAKPQTIDKKIEARKVFGLSRKAITADGPTSESAVSVKAGNTLATPQDNKVLGKDEGDLPIPVDEFLVESLPQLLEGFQVPYPESARKAGVQGSVRVKILVDANGTVRQATVVSSPNEDMSQAATSALMKFRFRPARAGGKNVAVNITYNYTFRLEP